MLNPAFLHHLREHALLLKYLAACLCSVGKKAEELQKVSIGKAIGPFDIPLTDFEKEYLEDLAEEEDYEEEEYDDDEYDDDDEYEEDESGDGEEETVLKRRNRSRTHFHIPQDQETLFKTRLSVEANLSVDNVFRDMNARTLREEEAYLRALENACSAKDYEDWKEEYISSRFQATKEAGILSCTYLFAGIGQYTALIQKDALPSFQCWIGANGSAFFGGSKPATDEEIRTYIAMHATKEAE